MKQTAHLILSEWVEAGYYPDGRPKCGPDGCPLLVLNEQWKVGHGYITEISDRFGNRVTGPLVEPKKPVYYCDGWRARMRLVAQNAAALRAWACAVDAGIVP